MSDLTGPTWECGTCHRTVHAHTGPEHAPDCMTVELEECAATGLRYQGENLRLRAEIAEYQAFVKWYWTDGLREVERMQWPYTVGGGDDELRRFLPLLAGLFPDDHNIAADVDRLRAIPDPASQGSPS